jgi:hypothetical protein
MRYEILGTVFEKYLPKTSISDKLTEEFSETLVA